MGFFVSIVFEEVVPGKRLTGNDGQSSREKQDVQPSGIF